MIQQKRTCKRCGVELPSGFGSGRRLYCAPCASDVLDEQRRLGSRRRYARIRQKKQAQE